MVTTTDWKARQDFVVYNTYVSAVVPNMPVLLTSANLPPYLFQHAKSDGSDIRFTSDVSGTQELPFEIVFYNPANNQAEIWVNVSAIQTSANTPFYCWFDNTSATAYSPTDTYGRNAVWTINNAIAVHHFHQTSAIDALLSGVLINSQGNSAYNANVSGNVYSSGSYIPDDGRRSARFYSAQNGRLVMNANVMPYLTNRTIQVRARAVTYGGDSRGTIISEEIDNFGLGGDLGHSITVENNSYIKTLRLKTALGDEVAAPSNSFLQNTWYNTAVSYTSASTSATASIVKIYIDGALLTSASQVIQNGGANTTIGAEADNETGGDFDGWIDELRVYDIVQSDYDISLSNRMQTTPSSMAMYVSGGYKHKDITGVSATMSVGSLSVTTSTVHALTSNGVQSYAGSLGWIDPNLLAPVTPQKRYRQNRKLNLVKFLPSMHRESETEEFTQLFQDFLNTLFDGQEGLTLSKEVVTVSGDFRLSGVSGDVVYYEYDDPNTFVGHVATTIDTDSKDVESVEIVESTDTSEKISVVEKIYRLTELKDPDLIDIENIQYFADNAGYNVDVYRPEFGNVNEATKQRPITTSETSASYVEQYLRFNISNMPEWYKIKTTDNAIQVLLYSYGLVGVVVKYYTKDYLPFSLSGEAGGNWIADFSGDLTGIPEDYFVTPHFAIGIIVDESDDLIQDATKRSSVIRAIQSIQPINTVFKKLTGYIARQYNMQVDMNVRKTRYIKVI